MDLEAFKASLDRDDPPDGLSVGLQALWHQAKGDWHRAHKLIQGQSDSQGAWVHAYLHRVEGNAANAGHWYRRAGKPHASAPLAEEWDAIVSAQL